MHAYGIFAYVAFAEEAYLLNGKEGKMSSTIFDMQCIMWVITGASKSSYGEIKLAYFKICALPWVMLVEYWLTWFGSAKFDTCIWAGIIQF